MPKLVVKYKSEILQEYIPGKRSIKIGRSRKNDIVIDDEAVSDEHCVIKRADKTLVVEDHNSAFGTSVNGIKIASQEVSTGDEIGIGNHVITVKPLSAAAKTKKPAGFKTEQPEAYLAGIQGKLEGRKFEISAMETRIGRSQEFNDIWISKEIDKSVSRRHATIRYEEGKYILTDRRSRNRTFVNQKQVNEEDEVVLKDKDEILIGKSIFRFFTSDSVNYSSPKKAGIFWVRFMPKFRKVAALSFLAGALFLMYKGIEGLSIIMAVPQEVHLENLNWSPEGFGRTWSGYLEPEQYDIIPSPAVGDINGDNKVEVVMADAGGTLYAWTGDYGYLLWKERIGQSMLTSPVLADINNDDVLDVIVGADNSRVYVLDGLSGQILYKSTFIGGKLLFASSPLVTDLDRDGFNDIVVVTDDKVICFLYSPVTGNKTPYYFRTPEDIKSSPVLVQAGPGTRKVAVATTGGKVYLFDTVNPENREVIDLTQKINMLKGVNLVLNEILSVPAVYDINSDGFDDLIFTTGSYYIAALNGRDNSLLWAYKIRPFSVLPAPVRYASPVLTDLNGDGTPDVIVGWVNGKVMAIDGLSGEPLWEYDTSSNNRIISSPALADFNKDGIMDPVITGEDGTVFILDGAASSSGRLLSNQLKIQGKISSTPCLGDINGDGYMEAVFTAADSRIHMLTSSTRVFKNKVFWHSFRQDSTNRGFLGREDIEKLYQMLAGAGFILAILVLLISRIRKKKKLKKRPAVINGK